MAGLLAQIRKINGLGDLPIAEPFAGGAGASLILLYQEEAPEIYINDADTAIHALWWSLVNRPTSFIRMLSSTPVTIVEWHRQRAVYRHAGDVSFLRRGFSAFYLNRCNRSGVIVNGGPIGGVSQTGPWKLNARFNKPELRRRCERVAEYRDRIHVSGLDGVRFIHSLMEDPPFCFIDPPYFTRGKALYLDTMDHNYHSALAGTLNSMPHAAWVLTYDDSPQVRRMYRGWTTIRPFSLAYTAATRRRAVELLIVPKWMRLPRAQPSAAITW